MIDNKVSYSLSGGVVTLPLGVYLMTGIDSKEEITEEPRECPLLWVTTDSIYINRVVSITRTKNGFTFEEECDNYFSEELTHDELDKLIEGLIAMRDCKDPIEEVDEDEA